MANFNFGINLYEFNANEHRDLLIRHKIAEYTNSQFTQVMAKTKKGLITFLCELEYEQGGLYPNELDIEEMKEEIYKVWWRIEIAHLGGPWASLFLFLERVYIILDCLRVEGWWGLGLYNPGRRSFGREILVAGVFGDFGDPEGKGA